MKKAEPQLLGLVSYSNAKRTRETATSLSYAIG